MRDQGEGMRKGEGMRDQGEGMRKGEDMKCEGLVRGCRRGDEEG